MTICTERSGDGGTYGRQAGAETRETRAAKPLLVLSEVLEQRYSDLAFHGRSVAGYSAMTARELGMSAERVERVALAGELHDVGKVCLHEEILRKPGKLTADEWGQIERHPQIGADLLLSSNLDEIAGWVLAHHERPDGNGYPHGAEAGEIPLESKIIAVTDAYDAMRTDRVYRAGMNHDDAAGELIEQAGTQFDSEVVDAFLRPLSRFGHLPQAA